jgi:hypothetical protein
MLQLALLRHCCDGAALARIVATLQQVSWQRYDAIALQLAATAKNNALCAYGNGRRRYAAKQRWQATKIFVFVFFFFLTNSFKERTRARQREKRQASKPVSWLCLLASLFLALFVGKLLPGSVCWQAPFWQCQLPSTVRATLAPSSSNNTSSIRNTSSSNDNLKIHRQKKFAAFNMKQQKNGVFLELK